MTPHRQPPAEQGRAPPEKPRRCPLCLPIFACAKIFDHHTQRAISKFSRRATGGGGKQALCLCTCKDQPRSHGMGGEGRGPDKIFAHANPHTVTFGTSSQLVVHEGDSFSRFIRRSASSSPAATPHPTARRPHLELAASITLMSASLFLVSTTENRACGSLYPLCTGG